MPRIVFRGLVPTQPALLQPGTIAPLVGAGPSFEYAPADILRWLLVAKGAVGDPTVLDPVTYQPTQDWPCYHSVEPDLPDNCLTLYDTEGQDDGRGMLDGKIWEHPGFQLRVRGVDQATAYAKVKQLRDYMTKPSNILMSGVTVGSGPLANSYVIHCLAGFGRIIPLGQDGGNSKRFLFTLNAYIAFAYKQP